MNVRLALYFWLFSILILGIVSYIYYQTTMQIIVEQVEDNTRLSIEQAAGYIENHIEKIQVLSDVIAQRSDIVKALESRSNMRDKGLINTFGTIMQSDQLIRSIAILSNDGQFITNDSTMFEMLSEDYTKKQWYYDALNSMQMPVLTSIRRGEFTMDKDTWVISIARQITSENGDHLGVLLIDISYRFIEQYLDALRLGEAGYSFVITDRNQLVYHRDSDYFNDAQKINKLVAICALDAGFRDDMDLVIFKSVIDHSNWILVGLSSLNQAKQFSQQLSTTVILISLLLTVLSLLIAIILSRRVSRPVQQLEQAIMETGERLQKITVDKRAPYEVQSLTIQYNEMLTRIKALIDDLKRVEDIRRIESIKMLQSQINPHFLYNTLDTIVWLSEFEDTQGVIEVTKSLGNMLRMGLNVEQSTISLYRELDYLTNYLTIQQYRYGDRFDYKISGQASLNDVMVPKLILQPIVENAIYHGFSDYKEGGLISIDYHKRDDKLIIVIKDNGVGYDDRAKGQQSDIQLGGIGLENVNRRIKLICGRKYGIEITTQRNVGTLVKYTLPLN